MTDLLKQMAEALTECKRLADACPELNLSNYDPDDVDALNAWAIEVAQAIDALHDAQAAEQAAGGGEAVEPCECNTRSERECQFCAQRRQWGSLPNRTVPVYTHPAPAAPVHSPAAYHPGSAEAGKMIDTLLAEYCYPSNPKNAARAGYMACG